MLRPATLCSAAAAALALAPVCPAQRPDYGLLELRARTHSKGWGLPYPARFDASLRPSLNNRGDLAFPFEPPFNPDSKHGIWFNGVALDLSGLGRPRELDHVSLNDHGV